MAIGASAGGIEALSELMTHLPSDTGMAFVLVQHLDPKHHSILTELLARKTAMMVTEVSEGLAVQAESCLCHSAKRDDVHFRPNIASRPARRIARDAHVRGPLHACACRTEGQSCHWGHLSGSGTDGTLGMAEIQAHGGVTFAQDEASAKYDGMPRSAVVAGHVDYVLAPKGIAKELARIARHPYVARDTLSHAAKLPRLPAPD